MITIELGDAFEDEIPLLDDLVECCKSSTLSLASHALIHEGCGLRDCHVKNELHDGSRLVVLYGPRKHTDS